MNIQRYCEIVHLKAEKRDEYLELHRAVWPEVEAALRASNFTNYTIFLRDDLLIGYFEYVGDDISEDRARIARDPATQRWWKLTDPCQTPVAGSPAGEVWAPAELVWASQPRLREWNKIVRTRYIEGTTVQLTEIGYGASSLGNLYRETTDDEASGAVQRAWDEGIRYFDTAPHYGLGLSEKRLGAALAAFPRNEYVVSTKVGRLLVDNPAPTGSDAEGFAVPDDLIRKWDFSRDGVLRSVEASLKRLQLDHIDILYAHDPDIAVPAPGTAAVETLIDLREQGVVRAVGAGTNSAETAERLIRETDIDIVMLAGRYTLLEQDTAASVMASARAHGTSIVAVGVFNSGLLSTERPLAGAHYNYDEVPPEILARAIRIADICDLHGVTAPQAAIAFPLRNPEVVNVTLGMRTAQQVQQNAQLYDKPVPDEFWWDLEASGLLSREPARASGSVRGSTGNV